MSKRSWLEETYNSVVRNSERNAALRELAELETVTGRTAKRRAMYEAILVENPPPSLASLINPQLFNLIDASPLVQMTAAQNRDTTAELLLYMTCDKNVSPIWMWPKKGTIDESNWVSAGDDEGAFMPGKFQANVWSENFINALDIHNLHHVSNGGFHYIFRTSKEATRAYTGHTQFLMQSIQNALFGELSFNLQSRNHNETIEQNNIERIATQSVLLLTTGALAGYAWNQLEELFARFFIYIAYSQGGRREQVVDTLRELRDLGASYRLLKIGPFAIEELRDEVVNGKGVIRRLAEKINEKVTEAIRNNDDFAESNPDNSDIADFQDPRRLQRAEGESDADLKYRRDALKYEYFLRRFDEVKFKFLPRYVIQSSPLIRRPIQYQSRALNLTDPIDQIRWEARVPFYGDDVHGQPILNQWDYIGTEGQAAHYISNLEVTLGEAANDHLSGLGSAHIDELFQEVQNYQNVNFDMTFLSGTNQIALEEYNNVPAFATEQDAFWMTDSIPDPSSICQTKLYFTHYLAEEEEELIEECGCIVDPRDRLEKSLLRFGYLWEPPEEPDHLCFYRCLFEAYRLAREQEAVSKFFPGVKPKYYNTIQVCLVWCSG